MSEENSELLFSYLWKIKNFPLCNHNNGEYISSPDFVIETLSDVKWYLKFYPRGDTAKRKEYFSIFLVPKDNKNSKLVIDFKIEAIYGDNTSLCVFECKNADFASTHTGWGWNRFLKTDEFMGNLDNWEKTDLSILCEISSKRPSQDIVSKCEALTEIGIDKCSFEWNISLNDSSDLRNRREFSFLPVPIEIVIVTSRDKFEIDIFVTERTLTKFRKLFCKISLLDVEGKEVISKCDVHLLTPDNKDWKFPSFLTRKQLQNGKDLFLLDNNFTLRFEIWSANGTMISCIEKYVFHPSHTPQGIKNVKLAINLKHDAKTSTALLGDLQQMFLLKKHCDVKLQLNNSHIIPAHKAVLAARSPVFSAMFDLDMLESQMGLVVIEDVTIETLNFLLEFIYTGSVQELNYEKALDLLIAADKYQILSLEEKCSDSLVSMLTVLNVCDVIALADMISYSPLKESAMNYMMENYKQVMSSQQWPEWVKVNNMLATEVLLNLSDFLQNMIEKELC